MKLSSPGPVIFRQRRTGLDGEEIVVYGFPFAAQISPGGTVTSGIVSSLFGLRGAARLMAAASQCTIEHHVIAGANHYYFGQPEQQGQAAARVRDWIAAQG